MATVGPASQPGAPEDRAKDPGVVNVANALPQVLAPVVAGVVIASLQALGDATAAHALYLAAAAVTVLGAVLMLTIKSVP
jgi:hypothetical protein